MLEPSSTEFKIGKKKTRTKKQLTSKAFNCCYCDKKYTYASGLEKHLSKCKKNTRLDQKSLKKPSLPIPKLDLNRFDKLNSKNLGDYLDAETIDKFQPIKVISTKVEEQLKFIKNQITVEQVSNRREINNLYNKCEGLEKNAIQDKLIIIKLEKKVQELEQNNINFKDFLTNIALGILKFTGSHNIEEEE